MILLYECILTWCYSSNMFKWISSLKIRFYNWTAWQRNFTNHMHWGMILQIIMHWKSIGNRFLCRNSSKRDVTRRHMYVFYYCNKLGVAFTIEIIWKVTTEIHWKWFYCKKQTLEGFLPIIIWRVFLQITSFRISFFGCLYIDYIDTDSDPTVVFLFCLFVCVCVLIRLLPSMLHAYSTEEIYLMDISINKYTGDVAEGWRDFKGRVSDVFGAEILSNASRIRHLLSKEQKHLYQVPWNSIVKNIVSFGE